MVKKALIFLSGAAEAPDREDFDLVVCADSGYVSARDAGIDVDVLIGDMDSIPPEYLDMARGSGVEISSHPADKDRTDGELALIAALERGSEEIVIIGGREGRLDHIISTDNYSL